MLIYLGSNGSANVSLETEINKLIGNTDAAMARLSKNIFAK